MEFNFYSKFIGKSSLGFQSGIVYNITITELEKNRFKLKAPIGYRKIQEYAVCEYDSFKALSKNWTNTFQILREIRKIKIKKIYENS